MGRARRSLCPWELDGEGVSVANLGGGYGGQGKGVADAHRPGCCKMPRNGAGWRARAC